MTFAAPWFLLLLLALPFLVWVGRPSRGPSRRREIFSLALRLLIALLLILGLAPLLSLKRHADTDRPPPDIFDDRSNNPPKSPATAHSEAWFR